jgi:hypothetical protein
MGYRYAVEKVKANIEGNRFSISTLVRLVPSSAIAPGNCETSPPLPNDPSSADHRDLATSSSTVLAPTVARTQM